jgi:hypothetical protein
MQRVMSKIAQCLAVTTLLLGMGTARAADEPAPPAPRVEEATKALGAMNEVLNYVKNKAKTAQDGRDVAKLNCVNEKSAQIQALIGVAQNFVEDLKSFMSAGEMEAADHELDKVLTAKRKVDEQKGEADSCVGNIEVGNGSLVREYKTGDLDKTDDPTTTAPPPDTGYRPPPASPVK